MSAEARFERSAIAVPQPQNSLLPDVYGLGGAVAGLGGGLAMAFVGLLLTIVNGGDVWQTSKLIAASVGVASVQPGFEFIPVVVGSILHLVVSALLGALFGIVTRRMLNLPTSFGVPLMLGIVYGLSIWAIASFLVLPDANPALHAVYGSSFVIQNLTYGVVLGILYGFLRPDGYGH
jgi:hypothetical protein